MTRPGKRLDETAASELDSPERSDRSGGHVVDDAIDLMAVTQLDPTPADEGWAARLEPMILAADSGSDRAPFAILHESDHTRVLRLSLRNGAGSLIVKELLGPRAKARRRHELGILERLAGVWGVPQLAPVAEYVNAIAMEDVAGVSLAEAIRVGRMAMPELLEFGAWG